MEKQSCLPVSESILAEWYRRQNVSRHCYELAQELKCYFTGYEDLVFKLICASIDLEEFANDVLPFDLKKDVL